MPSEGNWSPLSSNLLKLWNNRLKRKWDLIPRDKADNSSVILYNAQSWKALISETCCTIYHLIRHRISESCLCESISDQTGQNSSLPLSVKAKRLSLDVIRLPPINWRPLTSIHSSNDGPLVIFKINICSSVQSWRRFRLMGGQRERSRATRREKRYPLSTQTQPRLLCCLILPTIWLHKPWVNISKLTCASAEKSL